MVFWRRRRDYPHDQDYDKPTYHDEGFFTILIHFMGKFAYGERRGVKTRIYKDGGTQCFDMCSVDHMSMVDINAMVRKLKVNEFELMFYHYKVDKHDLDSGLRSLGTEIDMREMLKHVTETRTTIMQVYIEHGKTCINHHNMFSPSKCTMIEEIECGEAVNGQTSQEVVHIEGTRRELIFDLFDDLQWYNDLVDASQPKTQSSCVINDRPNGAQPEAQIDIEIPKDYSQFPDHGYDFTEEDFDLQTRAEVPVPPVTETSNEPSNEPATDDGNTSNTVEAHDHARAAQHDSGATHGTRQERNASGRGIRQERNAYERQRTRVERPVPETFGVMDGNTEEVHSEYEDNDEDELRSIPSEGEDGESEEPGIMYSDFVMERDMDDPIFKVGLRFGTNKELKAAINHYQVKNHRFLKFTKNNQQKVVVHCKGNLACTWYLYAAPIQGQTTWVIKTYRGEHNCDAIKVHPKADDNWIAKMYLEHLRSNPTMPIKSLIESVDRDHKLKINWGQAYRARRKALDLIRGDVQKQFRRIYDYRHELCSRNPGTTFIIKKGEDDGRFVRCYICLGAMKKGFKAGCRKLIGIDGCFLKGPCGGQLLSAVAIDPNDCIYPYAWAYVQVENTVTWTWFLRILKEDLEITDDNESEWTFISDRQKEM